MVDVYVNTLFILNEKGLKVYEKIYAIKIQLEPPDQSVNTILISISEISVVCLTFQLFSHTLLVVI